MPLRSQAKLRRHVLARLGASPAIREARIGRKSGADVLTDCLSNLSWPNFALLAGYVLGQAEAAPVAWIEADESRGCTATLATSDAPCLGAVSAEKDLMPAAVASAEDPFPNLEEITL